ncbi:MAG: nicotinate (nicotinamide) nucleotide adenylyltransferase [Parachlamydia sp.]|nr:nicotinate (nicotinamide) nucleotide adenylyltransferase [Parachlamydia sp.]
MKIGLFGGTFDPIHFGHLNLAVEMLEKRSLDEIWFCPARINPHKQEEIPTTAVHRLEMVRLAIEEHPRFRLLPVEVAREGPSYTYDTVRWLVDQEKDKAHPAQFSLILGEDALQGFYRWNRVLDLVELVPLLIGSRNRGQSELEGSPAVLEAIHKGLTPTRIMDISATEVRQRLQQGLYCGHLVPKEVLDYIKKHELYFNTKSLEKNEAT